MFILLIILIFNIERRFCQSPFCFFIFSLVRNKLVQCIDNLHIHAEFVISYTFLIS